MPDTDPQRISSGIAVLAEDEPTWNDGPFPVRGVALPSDVVANGANEEDVATYWPADVVRDAAALFDKKKIVDGSEHDPETVADNPQPSPETIIGEITATAFKPGVGVVFEGEVDDPGIAKRIDRGRVEVSPTMFRSLDGEHESGARIVDEVAAVRDLSIVAEGALTGNDIAPAAVAMATLSAEALRESFPDVLKSVAGVSFDATAGGTLDESEIPSEGFASHYLFDGDTKSESAYPVVDGDGQLRRGNVESAFQLGARGGVDESDLHAKLRTLNDEFDDPPIDPEKLPATTQSDDGTNSQSTDGPADSNDPESMTDEPDITDDQRAILAAADEVEDPIEVLEAAAGSKDPLVVAQADHEALQEDLRESKLIFAEALRHRGTIDMEPSKIATNFSYEALREEFEDDDGELAVDALVQRPEGGDANVSTGDNLSGEAAKLVEEWGDGDREAAVETLQMRRDNFDEQGWDLHLEETESQLETLGVTEQ